MTTVRIELLLRWTSHGLEHVLCTESSLDSTLPPGTPEWYLCVYEELDDEIAAWAAIEGVGPGVSVPARAPISLEWRYAAPNR